MIYKWTVFVLFLMASFVVSAEGHSEGELSGHKLKIVTSFSVLADLVQQVGQDFVEVYTLVDWDEDAHVYHPSPMDVRALSKAELLVINGLAFEAWLERLMVSSQFSGELVRASDGIDVINYLAGAEHEYEHEHEHGESNKEKGLDPHAWHSIAAVQKYVDNIVAALVLLDVEHKNQYQLNGLEYKKRLEVLAQETHIKMLELSDQQRHIVIPHNAFSYLARDYDLHVFSLKGVSSESESSAAQISQVIRVIKSENIKAIFSETTMDDRLIKLVQQETDAVMGGALISGALSKKLAPTYLDMMRYNINTILNAL